MSIHLCKTEKEFYDKINSHPCVMADFGATWCQPCKHIYPSIQKMAREYIDRLTIIAVDIDKMDGLADSYNIDSVPTFLFFKEGKSMEKLRVSGAKITPLRNNIETLLSEYIDAAISITPIVTYKKPAIIPSYPLSHPSTISKISTKNTTEDKITI